MRFADSPTAQQARDLAREAHRAGRRSLVLIAGDCRVEMAGRVRVEMGYGRRLVLLKGDGSLLVHRGEGEEPAASLPPRSRVEFLDDGGRFALEAHTAKERLRVVFRTVEFAGALSLGDEIRTHPGGLEAYLAHIERNPHLVEPGFRASRRHRETHAGVIDLFGYDREFHPVLVEARTGEAPPGAAYKLDMLVAEFRRNNPRARVRGIVVAPRVPKKTRAAAQKLGLEWKEVEGRGEVEDERQMRLQRFVR
ncbi:MAG: endonuclease NucS [Halobacteria archaeon]